MATQNQIDQHDRLMRTLADEFGAGLEPLFQEFFDELATIENPTRAEIQARFQRFRIYLREQLANVQQVVDSNLAMNAQALGETVSASDQAAAQQLIGEIEAGVNNTLDDTQTSVINAVIFGAVAGGITAEVLQELRSANESRRNTIQRSFDKGVRNFDGALTLIRSRSAPGEKRFTYVGGVVEESRDFCRRMDGQTLTEQEIRDIWASESWQGKEPGDPFVVRGGYNCRHMWVPVEEDE